MSVTAIFGYNYFIFGAVLWITFVLAQNEWESRDAFHGTHLKMDKVTSENCHSLHSDDLHLPHGAVSHLIDAGKYNHNPIPPNRTALLHVQCAHNMALNRAYFWSFFFAKPFHAATHKYRNRRSRRDVLFFINDCRCFGQHIHQCYLFCTKNRVHVHVSGFI